MDAQINQSVRTKHGIHMAESIDTCGTWYSSSHTTKCVVGPKHRSYPRMDTVTTPFVTPESLCAGSLKDKTLKVHCSWRGASGPSGPSGSILEGHSSGLLCSSSSTIQLGRIDIFWCMGRARLRNVPVVAIITVRSGPDNFITTFRRSEDTGSST